MALLKHWNPVVVATTTPKKLHFLGPPFDFLVFYFYLDIFPFENCCSWLGFILIKLKEFYFLHQVWKLFWSDVSDPFWYFRWHSGDFILFPFEFFQVDLMIIFLPNVSEKYLCFRRHSGVVFTFNATHSRVFYDFFGPMLWK